MAEHLHAALVAAYGESDPQCKAQFEKLRQLLRHDRRGGEKIIRALVHLRDRHPRNEEDRDRAELLPQQPAPDALRQAGGAGLPIGSGVTEAACKTLATQRMKRSGMHWRQEGGQAVLTFRAMAQSDRFNRG